MPVKEEERWEVFMPDRMEMLIDEASTPPAIGYLVWIRAGHDEVKVQEFVDAMKARGIRHVRTGVSWAEWVDPEGKQRIKEYLRVCAQEFTVLPCLSFTPPELAIAPRVNAPPKDLHAYARFVAEVLAEIGGCFDSVELWNEWNLSTDWDPSLDPEYKMFRHLISEAAAVAKNSGKRVVLGGPSKVNAETLKWLSLFSRNGMRENIDVLGFHNLRGTWSDHIPSMPLRTQSRLLREIWGRPVETWLTEYGFPVVDTEHRFSMAHLERIQVALFAYAVYACLSGAVGRVYWYTYRDEVHQSLRFATTGWEDILQFHFGDTDEYGRPRLLGKLLLEGGPLNVLRYAVRENIMPLVQKASLGRRMPGNAAA